jgi:hypothetical protein
MLIDSVALAGVMQFLSEIRDQEKQEGDSLTNIINSLFSFIADESKKYSIETRIIMGQICPVLWNIRQFKEALNEFLDLKNPDWVNLTREAKFSVLASSMLAKSPQNNKLDIVLSEIFHAEGSNNQKFNSKEAADLM